jgi:hypothetical protein
MMAKTHFDDIELEQPGIEADEINTESAMAGQILTADGAGGAAFKQGGALIRVAHGIEDTINSGAWYEPTDGEVEVSDPGFTYDGTTGEILIGPELEGKRLILFASGGIWNCQQAGTFTVELQVKAPEWGYFSTISSQRMDVVQSGDVVKCRADAMWEAIPTYLWRVRFRLETDPAGTGELALDAGITSIMAV